MPKTKSVYVCQNCGADSPKWIGHCPSCGQWNTYVEEIISTGKKEAVFGHQGERVKPELLRNIDVRQAQQG